MILPSPDFGLWTLDLSRDSNSLKKRLNRSSFASVGSNSTELAERIPGRKRQYPSLLKVQLACLGIIVVLGVAVWANLPYLLVEHSRLETWKVIGLWIGDIAGLVWFGRFVLAHAILAEPLVDLPASEQTQEFKFIVRAGILAIVLDLLMSAYLMVDEHYGYRHAQITRAEITSIQVHRRELADWYELDSTFVDADGKRHHAHLRVQADRHVLSGNLPAEAIQILSHREMAVGKLMPIRYDTRFPPRAWIDRQGWDDGNKLYWFSVGTSCLQTVVIAVFFLFLYPVRRGMQGGWPWWWDIYKLLPLLSEIFCMLMMGLIDRLMDSLN